MAHSATRSHHIRHPDRLFIGGEWVAPYGNDLVSVEDSTTEGIYLTVAQANASDVGRAVNSARAAFDTGPWPRMKPVERATYLARIADAWTGRASALADTWACESGAVRSWGEGAAAGVAEVYRAYASLADTFAWEERHTSQTGLPALLVREAVGVIAAVVPWNAPHALVAYKTAPALLAGCCTIVKASPEAPGAAYMLAEICEEVGLPAGVINVLVADRDVSEQLVRHPGVDKVSFTGSTSAGRRIAAVCGERIARYTLELGGKSPAIILDDFDLENAAHILAQSTSRLTGQVCAALTRVIVSRHRHDDLVDALAKAFRAIRVGDPFDPATQMGPLAVARQRDRVENYIAQGVEQGARLITGGRRPDHLDRGFFVEPTLFANVESDMTIAQEEIFGPVVSVIAASNDDDAISIANDTIYGLNASVFTGDPDRAYAVGRRLRTGTVGQNGSRSDFTIAFGGFKQSGVGREGGVEGLLPYTEAKTMVFESAPASVL